jgi:flagellar biosynthesis protein FlhB
MSDKTEAPSPRRLRRAREQGDIPVSAALTQACALMATLVILPASVAFASRNLLALVRTSIMDAPHEQVGSFPAIELITLTLILSTPLCAVAAVASVAVGLVQTGASFVPNKLLPDVQKLNPVQGFQNLFKLDRVYHVLRAATAAAFVAWLSVDVMLDEASSITSTLGNTTAAAALSASLVRNVLWVGAVVSLVLAAIDVAVTRYLWLKRNRMSKDEVKREHKEAEGDPELRQERKRAHQEVLNQASVLSIKDASVLIVNPTHLATALRYKDDEDQAPIVVAQGEDELARQMIDAARAYGIPVVRDVPVARALRELQVGDEIPEALYEAVAEILKELWTLGGGEDSSSNAD